MTDAEFQKAITVAYAPLSGRWPGWIHIGPIHKPIGPKAVAAAYSRDSLAELMQESGRLVKKLTEREP